MKLAFNQILKCKFRIFLFFFTITIGGCSFTPNELKVAERMIDLRPDSALRILQHIKYNDVKFNSDRALYGLLLFQALDKCYKALPPDSLINFSINYYQKDNNQPYLAKCYFYKGRVYKYAQRYDDAALLYLRSLDIFRIENDYEFLGKVYADLGYIHSVQHNFKEARQKYQLSIDFINRTGKTSEVKYIILSIGRTYCFEKKNKLAQKYYYKLLKQSNDSMFCGLVYQELGINYYNSHDLDSAYSYFRRSLHYPFRGSSYSIRNFNLSDFYFDTQKYDSAYQYALLALKYPANFFTQRECYRILVNVDYLRKNINEMSKYMTQYQSCSDSVRKVESQTKCTVLENLHDKSIESKSAKQNLSLIISILLIILVMSIFIVYSLYRRNSFKKDQLERYKQQLNVKQQFVSKELIKKIEAAKVLQMNVRKNALPDERMNLDKELYNSVLHIDDWEVFKREMNQVFNQIVDKLELDYPDITRKEIIWCCLELLDVPTADRMLLLDATTGSLYKLKQRLAKKMNLKSTKELDRIIRQLVIM